MISRKLLLTIVLVSCLSFLYGQKIVYSDYSREDTRRMDFEIAGKVGGNFLIYKNIRSRDYIAVLDNDMKEIERVEQDYVPDNDKMINVDFFPYNDFCYMIYQYQKRSIIYCMAAKINAVGHKVGDVIQLDTTHIGFAANNKIYTVLSSEDKSKLIVFKINSRNRKKYTISTVLMDDKLGVLKKSRLVMDMDDRDEFLGEFNVDNEGDLVFSKFSRLSSDNISKAAFVIKNAQADSFSFKELNLADKNLDEIRIKVDNANKRYFLTSFYNKQRRGNIDGLYFYIWDKQSGKLATESSVAFSDELKKEARGESGVKTAFNDYFIRNIITRRDGGFIIAAEAYYTTSRFNNWNRWDYLNRYSYLSPADFYYYSPYYNNWWGSSRFNNNQAARYHADNIAILSYNKEGKVEWNNVIAKSQYDDQADDLLSYQLMITGGQLHFLFNQQEKRGVQLLNDYGVTPDGQMNRNPTLKNLDKGYEFMPKYGKQVSAKQIIIPCVYRNYVCFAKIDYN